MSSGWLLAGIVAATLLVTVGFGELVLSDSSRQELLRYEAATA